MSLCSHNRRELEDRGFTVIKNLVAPDICAEARELVDSILGAPPPPGGQLGMEQCPTGDNAGARGQPGPWPTPGDDRPVITSGGWTHSIHHPISDPLMARLLEPFVELNRQLLHCAPASADPPADATDGLRLMQQFFRRTDLGPKPRAGCTSDGEPPNGWHQDQSFLPRHYARAPRSMFFHTILALHPVVQDGAPFFAASGSYRRARALSEKMSEAEQARVVPYADMTRTRLSGHLNSLAKKQPNSDCVVDGEGALYDPDEYEEVNWGEGDLLVLDPMTTHSGSSNGGAYPARYVSSPRCLRPKKLLRLTWCHRCRYFSPHSFTSARSTQQRGRWPVFPAERRSHLRTNSHRRCERRCHCHCGRCWIGRCQKRWT